jgi:nucleoside-diphosphate-sugar epimerase
MSTYSDKVLITGSKGFIGRHLIKELIKTCEVIEWEKDIKNLYKLNEKVCTVIHLASVSGQEIQRKGEYNLFDTNILGVLAVLDYCKRVGANLIFTSTSGVYKTSKRKLNIKETGTIEPSNLYEISKWLGEEIIKKESIRSSINTTILRLFNVYGPGQKRTYFVSYLIDCLINDKKMIMKHPRDYRDYIYIKDVVDAIIKVREISKKTFEVLNIGSSVGYKNIDVVRTAEAVFKKKLIIEYEENINEYITCFIADISKTQSLLDWNNKYDLKLGLKMMKNTYDEK